MGLSPVAAELSAASTLEASVAASVPTSRRGVGPHVRASEQLRRGPSLWQRGWLVALVSLFVGAIVGCRPSPSGGPALQLESADPVAGGVDLLLNDSIRLTFSAAVDATSVTRSSARLVDMLTGLEAEGDWTVDGRLLRFRPAGVRGAALSDGGLVPGHRYRLTLVGFPFLGALRSTDGASLDRSVSLDYRVVSLAAGAAARGAGPAVVRDASPGRAEPLRVAAGEPGSAETLPLPWDEALELSCAEPVDPRSIRAADYEFRLGIGVGSSIRPAAPAITVARIEVLQNEGEIEMPKGAVRSAGARLRFYPQTPFPVANGRGAVAFELHQAPSQGAGIRDFSGTPVVVPQRPIRFMVAREDVRSPEGANSYTFDFADDLDFVPVLDRGSDGTARWSGNGRVDIRYPAAAGDGRSGEVVLGAEEGGKDTQATRLSVPTGVSTRLTGDGLVVLRSQGRVNLDGALLRSSPGEAAPGMWDSSRIFLPGEEAESLSAWLKRAAVLDPRWTVIIAGGDLVVTGEIDIETPLLLVAGGRIRGAGRPKAAEGQLWLLGDGGGFELPHQHNPKASPNVVAPLLMDEPLHNPLARPLSFVAVSSPVPKGQRPRFWDEAQVIGDRGSGGDYRVQFLRADVLQGGEESLSEAARFDQPGLVLDPNSGGGAPVRMRVELVVHPRRGDWDPPYLDRVELAWSPER